MISARTIQPVDKDVLDEISDAKLIITIEDGIKTGGFGERVLAYLYGKGSRAKIVGIGYDFDLSKTLDEAKAASANGFTTRNIRDIIENTIKTVE